MRDESTPKSSEDYVKLAETAVSIADNPDTPDTDALFFINRALVYATLALVAATREQDK